MVIGCQGGELTGYVAGKLNLQLAPIPLAESYRLHAAAGAGAARARAPVGERLAGSETGPRARRR